MSYVRTLLSEHESYNWETVRRYQVEVPQSWRGIDPRFDTDLITIELSLSEGAKVYYQDTPYVLAEAVWLSRTRRQCGCQPLRCNGADWNGEDCRRCDVLYYRESPIVKEAINITYWMPPAPIVLHVSTRIDQAADSLWQHPSKIIAIMNEESVSARWAKEIIKERRQSVETTGIKRT